MTVLGVDAEGNPTEHDYCKLLRPKALYTITTEDVLAVLCPIWDEKRETASRLRGRIARILDAAKVDKKRSGDNPAAWARHLDKLLSKKRDAPANHKAVPYPKLPAFIAELRKRNSISASALEFTILCAAQYRARLSRFMLSMRQLAPSESPWPTYGILRRPKRTAR